MAWLPIPVFLPGESHGQRSLVGYHLQGCKELDITEVTALQTDSLLPEPPGKPQQWKRGAQIDVRLRHMKGAI